MSSTHVPGVDTLDNAESEWILLHDMLTSFEEFKAFERSCVRAGRLPGPEFFVSGFEGRRSHGSSFQVMIQAGFAFCGSAL